MRHIEKVKATLCEGYSQQKLRDFNDYPRARIETRDRNEAVSGVVIISTTKHKAARNGSIHRVNKKHTSRRN